MRKDAIDRDRLQSSDREGMVAKSLARDLGRTTLLRRLGVSSLIIQDRLAGYRSLKTLRRVK